MTQQELKEHYRKANVNELSELYFRREGVDKRRKHFEDVWLAVGFQARDVKFTLERVFQLLGFPDLAIGNPTSGQIGWLMQSVESTGEQDVIVGFDVESGVIRKFWSNGVAPECSPARHMIVFGNSEMKQVTTSNNSAADRG
jgi:hypothetical protein